MARRARRSAYEWRRLVGAHKRSGLSSRDFAARHGLAPATLNWWRSQFSQREPEVRLVPVDVAPAHAAGWQLKGASGDVLHVEGPLSSEQLAVVLEVLCRKSS